MNENLQERLLNHFQKYAKYDEIEELVEFDTYLKIIANYSGIIYTYLVILNSNNEIEMRKL